MRVNLVPKCIHVRRCAGTAGTAAAGLLLTAALLVAAPSATQPAQTPPAQPVQKAVDPHWSSTGCSYCHKMDGTKVIPLKFPDAEAVCLKCHDGRRALAEPHPVGRHFRHTTRPPDWPAPDDKVTCVTCHEVHPEGFRAPPRKAENRMFLRSGGKDMLTFCARCHTGAGEPARRWNPHVAQIQNGHLIEQACAFCHTKPMPSGEKATRTGDPALRADGVSLCIGCHTTHFEWAPTSHIGAKIPLRVRDALEAFAATAGHASAGPTLATGYLPLEGGNRVVCATCHNPHAEGVFPPGNILAAGAVRPAPAPEQLRGLGSNLCGACHAE